MKTLNNSDNIKMIEKDLADGTLFYAINVFIAGVSTKIYFSKTLLGM